jgi:hypothetical protein
MQDQPNVPYGYCHCGCGQQTGIAPRTSRRRGWTKGEPFRHVRGHRSTPYPSKGFDDDLRAKYDVDPDTGCWVWNSPTLVNGYGQVRRGGRSWLAHRYIYEQTFGPVPDGLDLDHLCRNIRCVNPDHLEPVTHAENMRRAATTKLDVQRVRLIRQRLGEGATQLRVAEEFGVARSTIRNIATGQTWKGT